MNSFSRTFVLLLAATLATAGCKKQADSAAPLVSPGAADQTAAAATNAALPSLGAASEGSLAPEANVLPGLDTASQAMVRKDYISASLALIKMDTKDMSPEEITKRAEAMRQVQRSVAEGAAAGDPRAIEAGNILRAASSK
jgi:hypothetical protein